MEDLITKIKELLDIEERNDIFNFTRKERAEFQSEVIEAIEEYKNVCEELERYEQLKYEERLVELPCSYNEPLFWVVNGYIKEVWFKGIRCDKGYKPQIIARFIDGNLNSKEEPITTVDNIGKTIFLTRTQAEIHLKKVRNNDLQSNNQ